MNAFCDARCLRFGLLLPERCFLVQNSFILECICNGKRAVDVRLTLVRVAFPFLPLR